MKTIPLAFSVLFFVATAGLAQDCRNVTPCEAYAQADAIFVARVIKIVPETIEIWQRDKDYDQIATLLIEKTYKGRKRHRLLLNQLGRKNAPKFILESRYLFYANFDRATKQWEVKRCGNTGMIEHVEDDLHYLDGLPTSLKKTRVAGAVVRWDTSDDNLQGTITRLAGIKVRIEGNGKEYEVITNAKGVYELYGTPAGTYVIQPETPRGLTLFGIRHYGIFDRSKARSLSIELEEGGCSGATIILTPDRNSSANRPR